VGVRPELAGWLVVEAPEHVGDGPPGLPVGTEQRPEVPVADLGQNGHLALNFPCRCKVFPRLLARVRGCIRALLRRARRGPSFLYRRNRNVSENAQYVDGGAVAVISVKKRLELRR